MKIKLDENFDLRLVPVLAAAPVRLGSPDLLYSFKVPTAVSPPCFQPSRTWD